jgi:hypothetical protein
LSATATVAVATATLVPTETLTATPTAIKFDAKTWTGMSLVEKMKAYDVLPATSPDGYTKSNPSTVKDNLVIYRDKSGVAMGAYDLLTGKFESMAQAGIVDFATNGGGKYEMVNLPTVDGKTETMPGFTSADPTKNVTDGLEYVSTHIKWNKFTNGSDVIANSWDKLGNQKATPLFKLSRQLQGYDKRSGGGFWGYSEGLKQYMEIDVRSVGTDTLATFEGADGILQRIYLKGVDADALLSDLQGKVVKVQWPGDVVVTPTP